MSERIQTRRCNESVTCPLSSNKSKQSKLLDKNTKSLMLHPSLIQAKLAISQPGDKYEQEADRIAEAVVNSGHDANGNPISFTTSPLIQRHGKPEAEQSGDKKIKKAAEKTGEAFLKTSLGQEIKEKALKLGLDFVNTLPGKIITGATAVSTVAYLAATNSKLPMQLPEIPIDVITPGLKVKLTYEGPVRSPTAASITFIFEENAKSDDKKGMTETEKIRAENARIAADQERFREGLKSPEQRAKEKAQFERAFWAGRGPLGLRPLKIPGIKREDELLQRKEADNSPTDSFVPPIVHEVLSSPGQPLDSATRAYMEPRFGYDFSRVRVHADDAANKPVQLVNAVAFTSGSHIAFGQGLYTPDTHEGRRLMAHELTHVIQQGMGLGSGSSIQLKPEKESGNEQERNNCGPNVTDWLINQMNTNKDHSVIKTMREVRWPRYIPGLNIGWTAGALYDFAQLVRGGGPWDFKSHQGLAGVGAWRAVPGKNCPTDNCDKTVTLCNTCINYDVPGNIHFGWVGAAANLRSWLLHFGAGIVQPNRWTDDPRDAVAVKIGEAMWNSGANLCDQVQSLHSKLNLDGTSDCLQCVNLSEKL